MPEVRLQAQGKLPVFRVAAEREIEIEDAIAASRRAIKDALCHHPQFITLKRSRAYIWRMLSGEQSMSLEYWIHLGDDALRAAAVHGDPVAVAYAIHAPVDALHGRDSVLARGAQSCGDVKDEALEAASSSGKVFLTLARVLSDDKLDDDEATELQSAVAAACDDFMDIPAALRTRKGPHRAGSESADVRKGAKSA